MLKKVDDTSETKETVEQPHSDDHGAPMWKSREEFQAWVRKVDEFMNKYAFHG